MTVLLVMQETKPLHSATTASQGVSCYNCYKLGHYSRDCRAPKTESHGHRLKVNTKQFATSHPVTNLPVDDDPVALLHSDSNGETDHRVIVTDTCRGSE